MTLDYTKMFLIVTEEAVVKGHFIGMHRSAMRARLGSRRYAIGYRSVRYIFRPERGVIFCGQCPRTQRAWCGWCRYAIGYRSVCYIFRPERGVIFCAFLGGCCAVKRPPCVKGAAERSEAGGLTTPPAACSADTSPDKGRLWCGAKSSEGRLWRAIDDRPYIITGGWRGNGTSRAGNR